VVVKSANRVHTDIHENFNLIFEEIMHHLESNEGSLKVDDIKEQKSEWQLFQALIVQLSNQESVNGQIETPHLEQILNFTQKINHQIKNQLVHNVEKCWAKLSFLRKLFSRVDEFSNVMPFSCQFPKVFETTADKVNWQNFILELSRKMVSPEFQSCRDNLPVVKGKTQQNTIILEHCVGNRSF